MMKPKLGEPKLIYEYPYSTIHKIKADFGTFTKEYYVSSDGQRAGIVVVREDEILFVRQYRLLINDYSLEIPGGGVNLGESPQTAAIRECHEETGILCKNLKPLIRYELALDNRDNPTQLFVCEEFEQYPQNGPRWNGTESVGVAWIPSVECIKMVFQGQIKDSFSIIAVLAYHAMNSVTGL